jgi:hypothetical protein
MMESKAFDRGYAHALGLGVTILVLTGFIAFSIGRVFILLIWFDPWRGLPFVAVWLYFTIQVVHYAIRTGFSWPLSIVASLAPLFVLFVLENGGLPVAAGSLMIGDRLAIILSMSYGILCVCVAAYWFIFGKFTPRKLTKRPRNFLWLSYALASTAVLIFLVLLPTLPRWVSDDVLLMQKAARHGDLPTVKLLIESGVDPRAKDQSGWDTLMWALYKDHEEIVAYLLDHGADPNTHEDAQPQGWWHDPLDAHVYWHDPEDPGYGFVLSGRSALSYAAEGRNFNIAVMLIQKGADINSVDVCKVWHPQTLKLLLEKGKKC